VLYWFGLVFSLKEVVTFLGKKEKKKGSSHGLSMILTLLFPVSVFFFNLWQLFPFSFLFGEEISNV